MGLNGIYIERLMACKHHQQFAKQEESALIEVCLKLMKTHCITLLSAFYERMD